MHWLNLTLLSAFCLATADMLTKRYLSNYRTDELVLVRFSISGLLILPLFLWQPWPSLPLQFWFWVAGLIPLEILAMWLYMTAIRQSPLSLTVPYLAFTPAFNILTGYLFLGETVSATGFSGILLIVSGAWLLNLHHAHHSTGLDLLAPFKAITREYGSRLMLGVAALYSLTSVMGKGALQYTTPAWFGSFYYVIIGLATIIVFGCRKPASLRIITKLRWAHLGVAVFMAGMVLTHFYAINHIEVAYMIAVKRTSLLFGILYGAWIFKEANLHKNMLAGVLMVAGVYLIVS